MFEHFFVRTIWGLVAFGRGGEAGEVKALRM
jgi:hypothetical protein